MIRACRTLFFFFNDTATTEIYTLSLHDALPISGREGDRQEGRLPRDVHAEADLRRERLGHAHPPAALLRRAQLLLRKSEEHTTELQSQSKLVSPLLLAQKNPMGRFGSRFSSLKS